MLLVAARVPGTLFASLGFSPSWMVKILFGSRQLCWRPQAAHHLLLRGPPDVVLRWKRWQCGQAYARMPPGLSPMSMSLRKKKKSVLCARICWTTLRRRVASFSASSTFFQHGNLPRPESRTSPSSSLQLRPPSHLLSVWPSSFSCG